MRIKITAQYNGASYLGLQSQTTTDNTIMGTLQNALLRLGIEGKLIASGRTDKGVHASAQVLHCDLPSHWHELKKLKRALNHQLSSSIRIRRIDKAADDFHARYSAKRRVYRYVLSAHEPNPFEADFITFTESLNFDAITQGISAFVGTHDFRYFKKTGSDTDSDIRTIYKAKAYRYHHKIVLMFEANGYLRSQIRMMVGFLLQISEGELTREQLVEQLHLLHSHCTKLAPPNGLYLARVIY